MSYDDDREPLDDEQSMPAEDRHHALLRIFGPPGTGKTTTLAGRVRSTIRDRGPQNIVIASFSVTAAREIARRPGMGALPPHAIGTLHSHAFRAIGHPTMVLDPKVVADWNTEAPEEWAIAGDTRGAGNAAERGSLVSSLDQARTGDELLSALNLLRARQAPVSEWPPLVLKFAKAWTSWKRSVNGVDYTDMITHAYARARDGEPLEGNPEVFVVDEAQDMTPIETALALEWSKYTDRTVFALDDDQAINEWRGGSPRLVLDAAADDLVLEQSYRVPPAVHAVAQAWISQVDDRVQKAYRPRERQDDTARERWDRSDEEADGSAYKVGYALNSPMLLDALERDVEAGRDAMVLVACNYMLIPLIKELRRRGLPFHNPYRPSDATWNPLGSEERTGMATAERLFRFLLPDESLGEMSRLWTGEDVAAWAEMISLKAAHMRHGAGNMIKTLPSREEVPWETIEGLFQTSPDGSTALSRAVAPDLEWLAGILKASYAQRASYPIQVARTQGAAALATPPQIVIGTLHSVKGATASRVYLSPDLSPAGMRQWQGKPEQRNQTRRLFYVGVTRAFHDLILLSPGSMSAVPPSELIPPELEVRR